MVTHLPNWFLVRPGELAMTIISREPNPQEYTFRNVYSRGVCLALLGACLKLFVQNLQLYIFAFDVKLFIRISEY